MMFYWQAYAFHNLWWYTKTTTKKYFLFFAELDKKLTIKIFD